MRACLYGRQSRDSTKSVNEQLDAGRREAADNGWPIVSEYADGVSASRFATRKRDEWPRVLDDIDRRAFDVLLLWEASRGDRTPETWLAFLALCRDRGVLIHIIADERTYDMRKRRDWRTLAEEGINSADESEKIAERVRRGLAGAAQAGRPTHGRCPDGYRRVYDPRTGTLLRQEVDPDRAPVIREIFERVARGEPVSAIVTDFNERGVPGSAGAARWYRVRVRDIAASPAYRAARVHNGEEYPAAWPAVVDDELWYAAARVLADPRRVTTRPGRQVHLLSYLATCAECEPDRAADGLPPSPLTAVRGRYRCLDNSCVRIEQQESDEHVRDVILGVLARPDWHTRLRQAGDDADREVVEARAELARLRGELDRWRQSAAAGETTPESLAVVEASLSARIRAADRRAQSAGLPPALRAMIVPGLDVRIRWDDAPLAARRDVIRSLCTIRVRHARAQGVRRFDHRRIEITPLQPR